MWLQYIAEQSLQYLQPQPETSPIKIGESYELVSTGVGKRWSWGKQDDTEVTQLAGQSSE